jgi:peptidoglycan/LPS O-acetylase OafA/YrhL
MGTTELYLLHWIRLVYLQRRATVNEGGYTTQVVIMTALLAALALAVGIIITTKVLAKANSVDLNGNGN